MRPVPVQMPPAQALPEAKPKKTGRPRKPLPPSLGDTLNDPLQFIAKLDIIDKKGRITKLRPNWEQMKVIEALHSGDDVLILKPRQIGSTTAVAAYFFWKWYTSRDPMTHVILSHKMASAQHIFEIFKRFWSGLPPALQRELSVVNGRQMTLKDTGATVQAHSAGGEGGLRSFTASSIHMSEFAFAPDGDELKATAISALNGGQLCIESTANHWGDPLHQEIQLWDAEMVEWNFLFFPWTQHAEYVREPPNDWIWDGNSPLTIPQQYWEATMVGKLGRSKFRREYPLTVEDAYAQTDGAWIDSDLLDGVERVQLETEGGALAKPDKDDRYAIGVDAGAGTGGDFSALVVLSVGSGQIVEIRRSNSLNPTLWAEVVADASRKWGDAKVLVESNGTWGGVIITELKHAGIPLWKGPDGKDWITTGPSKAAMLEGVKDAIGRCSITMIDTWTIGELRSFKVNDRGEPFCPRNGIHHGDTVIALALALQCAKGIHVPPRAYLPEWVVRGKIARASRAGSFEELRRY